jgi:ketosteroid isomerase-like protein
MAMENKTKIIESYIRAYNNFDTGQMLVDIDDNVHFENIAEGKVILSISGKEEFKIQAEKTRSLFKNREQEITSVSEEGDRVEVDINFKGVLGQDTSNKLKSGDLVEMKGKSIFTFRDNKIVELTEIILPFREPSNGKKTG